MINVVREGYVPERIFSLLDFISYIFLLFKSNFLIKEEKYLNLSRSMALSNELSLRQACKEQWLYQLLTNDSGTWSSLVFVVSKRGLSLLWKNVSK